ncbi:hypothetical protein [Arthrobacter psychrolactophilus]
MVVLFGLSRISGIVGPVFLALVLTICVYLLKQRLINRGVPAALATVSTILAVYVILAALVASLWVSAVQLTRLLPQYTSQITELGNDLLFARAILVDAHPQSAWLRPFLGDIGEAKALLASRRAATKAAKSTQA